MGEPGLAGFPWFFLNVCPYPRREILGINGTQTNSIKALNETHRKSLTGLILSLSTTRPPWKGRSSLILCRLCDADDKQGSYTARCADKNKQTGTPPPKIK